MLYTVWALSLIHILEKTRKVIEEIGHGESVGIFIGPEGGFDRSELDEAVKKGLLKPYVGAYTQIDFSRPCPSIFDTSEQIKAVSYTHLDVYKRQGYLSYKSRMALK